MSKIRKSPQKQTAIRAKEALTESLRLPRDVMLGASILTLIGDTELLVENYRGILEYTQECILLQGKHTRIRIEGCCLKIVYYTNEDMKIAGKICGGNADDCLNPVLQGICQDQRPGLCAGTLHESVRKPSYRALGA